MRLDVNACIFLKKYIVIEKENQVVQLIRNVMDEKGENTFCGSSDDYNESLEMALKMTPDIIFMDIDNTLDDLKGFLHEVLQYSQHKPVLVALSQTKEKAFFAYKNDFFDYILKPLTSLSIRRCLLKYQKTYPPLSSELICIKSNKDFNYLNTEDILFLKADNNTTDFYLKDGIVIHAFSTLKTYEKTLPGNFLRIHKSYIINRNFISRIHYGKSICVIKKSLHKIPFTKTFMDNVNSIVELLSNKAILTLN